MTDHITLELVDAERSYQIHAHKYLLYQHSKYFASILINFQESKQNTIYINVIDAAVAYDIIKSLYGSLIVFGSYDGTFSVWNDQTDTIVFTVSMLKKSSSILWCGCFFPNDDQIIICYRTNDYLLSLLLYNIRTKQLLHKLCVGSSMCLRSFDRHCLILNGANGITYISVSHNRMFITDTIDIDSVKWFIRGMDNKTIIFSSDAVYSVDNSTKNMKSICIMCKNIENVSGWAFYPNQIVSIAKSNRF